MKTKKTKRIGNACLISSMIIALIFFIITMTFGFAYPAFHDVLVDGQVVGSSPKYVGLYKIYYHKATFGLDGLWPTLSCVGIICICFLIVSISLLTLGLVINHKNKIKSHRLIVIPMFLLNSVFLVSLVLCLVARPEYQFIDYYGYTYPIHTLWFQRQWDENTRNYFVIYTIQAIIVMSLLSLLSLISPVYIIVVLCRGYLKRIRKWN